MRCTRHEVCAVRLRFLGALAHCVNGCGHSPPEVARMAGHQYTARLVETCVPLFDELCFRAVRWYCRRIECSHEYYPDPHDPTSFTDIYEEGRFAIFVVIFHREMFASESHLCGWRAHQVDDFRKFYFYHKDYRWDRTYHGIDLERARRGLKQRSDKLTKKPLVPFDPLDFEQPVDKKLLRVKIKKRRIKQVKEKRHGASAENCTQDDEPQEGAGPIETGGNDDDVAAGDDDTLPGNGVALEKGNERKRYFREVNLKFDESNRFGTHVIDKLFLEKKKSELFDDRLLKKLLRRGQSRFDKWKNEALEREEEERLKQMAREKKEEKARLKEMRRLAAEAMGFSICQKCGLRFEVDKKRSTERPLPVSRDSQCNMGGSHVGPEYTEEELINLGLKEPEEESESEETKAARLEEEERIRLEEERAAKEAAMTVLQKFARYVGRKRAMVSSAYEANPIVQRIRINAKRRKAQRKKREEELERLMMEAWAADEESSEEEEEEIDYVAMYDELSLREREEIDAISRRIGTSTKEYMEHRDEIEDMTEVEREEFKKEAAEYGVTFTQIINMTQEEKDNAGSMKRKRDRRADIYMNA